MARWGNRRVQQLRQLLDRTPTIPADPEVIDAYAALMAACQAAGHGLQHKQHTGDRWIAAAAIAKGLPMLAGDQIYRDVPGLTMLEGNTGD